MKLYFSIPLVGIIIILLSACHAETKHISHKPSLQVTQAVIKDTVVLQQYVCQIHAAKRIELRALERGYLERIFVDEGQLVNRGQDMFKIMPNVYEAEYAKSSSEAEIARIEYENTKRLADKGVVSENELLLAKAKLSKAEAEKQLANTHLLFTDVNAPFTGIMDHLHVREGSLLEEGELLTTLSDNSNMWVYYNIPEVEYLNFMTSGQAAKNTKVLLQMANGKLFEHEGKVETIEGEFDHETGNIEFRALFQNDKRILRHGETGNILMQIPYEKALIIPQKATFEVLDKKYVYVVDNEHNIHQKEIKIAHELPHLYIVESGLKASDKILLEGLRKVKDGDQIEVQYRKGGDVLASLNLHAE